MRRQSIFRYQHLNVTVDNPRMDRHTGRAKNKRIVSKIKIRILLWNSESEILSNSKPISSHIKLSCMHTTYKDGRRRINDVGGVTMQMHMRNAIIHHHVVEEPVTLPIYHILSEIQVSVL